MIQRIQSLFLLVAISCSVAVFFVDFAECLHENTITRLSLVSGVGTAGDFIETSSMDLLIVNILTLIIGVWALVSFKNRSRQMRICMVGGLSSLVLVVLIFYHADQFQLTNKAHYLLGTYLIAVQTITFTLARRFIRKDELLVRSADRIR
ncbi:MAG: DUF4293 domain-containing protein [Bacteroidota bacterium]